MTWITHVFFLGVARVHWFWPSRLCSRAADSHKKLAERTRLVEMWFHAELYLSANWGPEWEFLPDEATSGYGSSVLCSHYMDQQFLLFPWQGRSLWHQPPCVVVRPRYSTVTLSVWGSHISMWWLITKKTVWWTVLYIILYNSLTFLDKIWWNHVSFLAGIQFSGICISCSDMNGAGHWAKTDMDDWVINLTRQRTALRLHALLKGMYSYISILEPVHVCISCIHTYKYIYICKIY